MQGPAPAVPGSAIPAPRTSPGVEFLYSLPASPPGCPRQPSRARRAGGMHRHPRCHGDRGRAAEQSPGHLRSSRVGAAVAFGTFPPWQHRAGCSKGSCRAMELGWPSPPRMLRCAGPARAPLGSEGFSQQLRRSAPLFPRSAGTTGGSSPQPPSSLHPPPHGRPSPRPSLRGAIRAHG